MSRNTEPHSVSKNSNSSEFSDIYVLAVRAIDVGIHSHHHPYHLVSVANVGASGFPELRTVVLRTHNLEERFVVFHTDIRSPKIHALRSNFKVSLLMYDPQTRTQLRLKALAEIHHKDPFSDTQWENTRAFSKYNYLNKEGSGVPVASRSECTTVSSDVQLDDSLVNRVAYEYFSVIKCSYFHLDYTHLRDEGHERALISWDSRGTMKGEWVVV